MMHEIQSELLRCKDDPQYAPFYKWIIESVIDEKKKDRRVRVMQSYTFRGIEEVLKTTPFPVPPKLQMYYALISDMDRQIEEDF